MQAREILRLVSGALQDLEPDVAQRWPWTGNSDNAIGLLDFLNDAIRAVAMQRPDCCAVTENITLEPGMRQRLPLVSVHGSSRNATGFCELVRNMGLNGKQPGRAILSVDQQIMMAWMANVTRDCGRTSTEIDNFAYDRATNPKVYYVYPAVPTERKVYVEATYYTTPAQITSAYQELDLMDGYAQALGHYMLSNILAADNEATNFGKADYYLKLFQNDMNLKLQADMRLPRAKNSLVSGVTQ